VDGRFLWDTLHARMNPIGRPYEDVYSWLACIGINPCWQWYAPRRTHGTHRTRFLTHLVVGLRCVCVRARGRRVLHSG
jgi:hypothetical protein